MSKRSGRENGAEGKKVLTGSRGKEGGGALIDHTIRKGERRGEEGRKVNEGKKTGGGGGRGVCRGAIQGNS